MSKGLEALEKIDNTLCLNLNNGTLKFGLDKYDNCDCKDLKEFDECYEVIEKSLKALEIIKKHPMFYLHDDLPKGTYKMYDCELYSYYDLTKEEYDLLKEVLL